MKRLLFCAVPMLLAAVLTAQGVELTNPPNQYLQDSATSPTRVFDYNSGDTWDLSVPQAAQMTWDSLDNVYYNNSTTEKWIFTLPPEDGAPAGARYHYEHRQVNGTLIDQGWIF